MLLRDPFTKWLWDNRRSILAWTLAITGVGAMYAAFWPTIDNPQMQQAIENYPKALLDALNYSDITTPSGYLNATVYGLVVALLMIVEAISAGTRCIAGDEDAGTLDLILAHPISRRRLALERFAAVVCSVTLSAVALLLALLVVSRPARLADVSVASFGAMTVHLTLFAVVFAAVSFSVGATTGHRSWAIASGAALAVFGFAANGILPQFNGFEWVRAVSPFHWLNGGVPLRNGVEARHAIVMVVVSAALVGTGVWTFDRRDIGGA